MPHMHLRGKDFEYRVEYPDGRSEVVLSVPHYDFAWQMRYVLAEPLRLPAGSKVVCTAHFDNSSNNPNNPDPTHTVSWGPQTWDEMMIGWMQYYHPEEKIAARLADNGTIGSCAANAINLACAARQDRSLAGAASK